MIFQAGDAICLDGISRESIFVRIIKYLREKERREKILNCYHRGMVTSVLIAGSDARWDVRGVVPDTRVVVDYGFAGGSTVVNDQFGYCATFEIMGIILNTGVGTAIADGAGLTSIVKKVPNNAKGLTILTRAAERGTCSDEYLSNVDSQVVQ